MSLPLLVGSSVALLAVTVPSFWLLSRLALRTSAPTVWLRRLLVGLLPVAGVSYLVATRAAVDDLVGNAVTGLLPDTVPATVTSVTVDVAVQFTLFLWTAVVVLATYAVVVPAIRQARELELSTWTAIARLGRYAVPFVGFLTVLFVPFRRMVSGESTGFAPAVLVVLVLALPLASPFLLRVFRRVRTPSPSERNRLGESCERVGLDVVDLWVLRDADESLEIHVRGPPGRRQLFVSAFALEALDHETLTALLATTAGSVETHYRGIKLYPLFGFIIAGIVAFVSGSPVGYAVVIGVALLLPLPVLWAARRAVRRADAHAAECVGGERVADALERSARVQNLDIPAGGWGQVFRSRPALAERIERLRDGNS